MADRHTSVTLLLLLFTASLTSSLATVREDGGEGEGGRESELPYIASLTLKPQEVDLESGKSKTFNLSLSEVKDECIDLCFDVSFSLEGRDIGGVPAPVVLCCPSSSSSPSSLPITFNTTTHGLATLSANTNDSVDTSDAFSILSVMKDQGITTTADVLGWLYTIAWDISFLPQIVHNWRRKSVVGLSFDFLSFNFLGFFSYFIYNMGMLWLPVIQDEYYQRHPRSVLHVRLNDVIFPLYALICVAAQIAQCLFYKKEPGQRVSIPCRVIIVLLILSALVWVILVPAVDDVLWIDVLYWLSYIKLAITAIKYTPQLYTNYKHKSTGGWSIYQVILDFSGGVLSLIQMFLLAANYNDWKSVLTDPAKLGLGLLSILFNILFFIQHYCLYRGAPLENEEGEKKKKKKKEEEEGEDNAAYEKDVSMHM